MQTRFFLIVLLCGMPAFLSAQLFERAVRVNYSNRVSAVAALPDGRFWLSIGRNRWTEGLGPNTDSWMELAADGAVNWREPAPFSASPATIRHLLPTPLGILATGYDDPMIFQAEFALLSPSGQVIWYKQGATIGNNFVRNPHSTALYGDTAFLILADYGELSLRSLAHGGLHWTVDIPNHEFRHLAKLGTLSDWVLAGSQGLYRLNMNAAVTPVNASIVPLVDSVAFAALVRRSAGDVVACAHDGRVFSVYAAGIELALQVDGTISSVAANDSVVYIGGIKDGLPTIWKLDSNLAITNVVSYGAPHLQAPRLALGNQLLAVTGESYPSPFMNAPAPSLVVKTFDENLQSVSNAHDVAITGGVVGAPQVSVFATCPAVFTVLHFEIPVELTITNLGAEPVSSVTISGDYERGNCPSPASGTLIRLPVSYPFDGLNLLPGQSTTVSFTLSNVYKKVLTASPSAPFDFNVNFFVHMPDFRPDYATGDNVFNQQLMLVSNTDPAEQPMRVWPNPASDHLSFVVKAGADQFLEIYEITGRLCRRYAIGNGSTVVTVNVADLAPGAYLARQGGFWGQFVKYER